MGGGVVSNGGWTHLVGWFYLQKVRMETVLNSVWLFGFVARFSLYFGSELGRFFFCIGIKGDE